MKVVVAPDKFAGTLSAAEAAEAMATGWRQVRPDDETVLVPIADGGEGTIDVVASVRGVTRHVAEVADARGRACEAAWLSLPDGRTLVEAAQAVGLSGLAPEDRDPLTATSYGVGQLIAAAAAEGASEIVTTLGGSATSDGGAGAVTALGHRLLRADGNRLKVGALPLRQLDRVELGPALGTTVTVACDVNNPLLGPAGAATVFGPQKGAGPDDVPALEAALTLWADVVERDVPGGPWRHLPGAGAAGGLGFALAAFVGARLAPGAATIAELVGFHAAVADADVVITGEGKLDGQTAHGKAPGYVAEQARARGARVLAIAGQITDGAEALADAARALGPEGFDRPAQLCAERAAELATQAVDQRWA